MKYSLSNLDPSVIASLKEALQSNSEVEIGDFLESLKAFLGGSGTNSAQNDLAFSVGAELNAGGIIDMIPTKDLKLALADADVEPQKAKFFLNGLPKRHRDRLTDIDKQSFGSDQPVIALPNHLVRGIIDREKLNKPKPPMHKAYGKKFKISILRTAFKRLYSHETSDEG